jgi:predicted nucleic acid-binding Zn ribbon protein
MVEAGALARWDVAVGPAIAKHTRAIKVQDSVIWVEVDHPIWKSELHHRKRQILAILNNVAGPDETKEVPVSDILFLDPRSGSRPQPKPAGS